MADWLIVINVFYCRSSNRTEGKGKLGLAKQSSMDCDGIIERATTISETSVANSHFWLMCSHV